MLTPKHNHDAHDGTLKAADTWLRGWMPLLLAGPDYTSGRLLLFDFWLLPPVDGQFTGTTDEIWQWAACKWGVPDNLIRGQRSHRVNVAPYPAYAGNQNGTFPFTRDSTAAAADYWGAYIRGCYNGWESWLKDGRTGTYAAGDIWGCIGSWYSGDWHSSAANGYISRVQAQENNHTWLTRSFDDSTQQYDCNATYGCPR